MPPLNATDLQMYPCAGNPPIDAFLTNDILSTPAAVVIDAIAGANTNRGLGLTTALADPFELEQRWGGGRVTEQGPVGNSPPVPRRAAGAIGVSLVNIVNGWTLRVPFELARTNQIVPNQSLLYQLPLNGVGVALNATLTFWDEGGTCSPVSQIQVSGNGVNVGGVPIFALNNPSQQITIQWDGANWQVIANTNPGGAPGVLGQRTTFVFRPGGVPFENVYTSWPLMMADVANVAGPKWIEIDGSIAAAHVPAGVWNIDLCTFVSKTVLDRTLTWDQGATATWKTLTLIGARFVNASTNPVTTQTTVTGSFLYLYAALFSSAAGAAPWVVCNGDTLTVVAQFSTLGDGTHQVLQQIAGTLTVDVLGAAVMQANALTAVAATVRQDDASNVSPTQVGMTLSLISLASAVSFTPGVGANWNPIPALSSAALDQLAAPNFFNESNAAPIGAAASISYTTVATITKSRSGKVNVRVSASVISAPGADVGGDNISIQILRDGAIPITDIAANSQNNANAVGSPRVTLVAETIDTLPNTLAHTYQVVIASNGAAGTVAANALTIKWTVQEL